MLTVNPYSLYRDPCCTLAADNLVASDFFYYDKDGFELNLAERKYYQKQGIALHDCLNHICNQMPWFAIDSGELIIDHSIVLHRASYAGSAVDQLEQLKANIPFARYLINTKQKWGFDFALDACIDDQLFEVIHIEYDDRSYERFVDHLGSIEQTLLKIDWADAARMILSKKDQWQELAGYEQNHWKSNYLIGWNKAEYTEKAV